MSRNNSRVDTIADYLMLAYEVGGMAFLGLIGVAVVGAAVTYELPDEEAEEALVRFHPAQQVPWQCPLMPSPYSGTLAGMCRRCGSGDIAIPQSPVSGSSTRAWSRGMRAYEGFGREARRSERAKLQGMADGELFDLMEEILQESKRRRSARSDIGC